MGKVMSLASRKLNRFNIENRAARILERDKPTAAPKYKSNLIEMQKALELDPDLVEKLNKKDEILNERLKSVYVTSESHIVDTPGSYQEAKRPLPLDRTSVDDFEYGHKEPKQISFGRCSLRQVVKFIGYHAENPQLWTTKKIADEYSLKEEVVGKILKYYKPFQLYLPDADIKSNYPRRKTQLLQSTGDPEKPA